MQHLLKLKILFFLKTLARNYSGIYTRTYIVKHCLEIFAALRVEIPVQVKYSEGVQVEKFEMNITDRAEKELHQLSISCHHSSLFNLLVLLIYKEEMKPCVASVTKLAK